MNKLIRSYLKTSFKYWIESISTILFIILISLSLGGLMSGTLQFKQAYNDLSNVSQPWNYQVNLGDATKQEKNIFSSAFKEFFFDYNHYLDINSNWWKNNVESNCNKLDKEQKLTCENKAILNELNLFYLFQSTSVNDGAGINAQKLQKYNYSGIWAFYNNLVSKFQSNNDILTFDNAIVLQDNASAYKFNLSSQKTIASFNNNQDPVYSKLNQVKIYEGRLAIEKDEVVVDPVFAKNNNLKINEEYLFPDSDVKVKIVGIGLALDNMDNKINKNIGYFYGTNNLLSFLINNLTINNNNNVSLVEDKNYIVTENLKIFINSPNINFYNSFINDIGTTINNFFQQVKLVNNFNVSIVNVQLILYSVLSVILLILAFVIIIFNLKKEINRTYYQIGLFKAFGYNNSSLAFIFAIKCFLFVFFGLVIGYCLSFPLQLFVNKLYLVDVLMPLNLIYFPWQFLLLLLFIIPIFFSVIAFILIYFYLKKDLLLLINSGSNHSFEFFRNFIKTIFYKAPFILKLQVSFMTKNFLRFLTIIFVFGLASLLFILQFNISTIFYNITDSINYAYKLDDHISNFSASQEKFTVLNNKLELKNNTNMRYVTYQNAIKEGQFAQADEFHTMIKNMKDGQIWELLKKKADQTINNKFIYLDDLVHISNSILTIFKDDKHFPTNIKNYLKLLINMKKNIVQTNFKTIVSLNEVIYNPELELPILSVPIKLENNLNLSLTGVKKENWQQFYFFKNVNKNKLDDFFKKKTNNVLPVIISQKFLKYNDWKIGDVISSKFLWDNKKSINFSLKIIDAISYDTLNQDIFVDQSQLQNFFVDKNNKPINVTTNNQEPVYFYNKLISKEKLFLNKIDIKTYYYNSNQINYEIQYQNIVFQDLQQNNKDISISDVVKLFLDNKMQNFNLYSSYANIRSLLLPRIWLQSEGYILNEALFILQVFIACLIFLAFLIVCASLLDENRHIIFVLHSFGYKHWQIIFAVIGSYFIGVIIIFFLAYLISLGALSMLIPFIWAKFGLLLIMPWSILIPLQTLGILVLLLILTWIIATYITKKQIYLLGGYK